MPVDADIGCDVIVHVLKAVIAADYLGLCHSVRSSSNLRDFAGANLASILLKDRASLRMLTSSLFKTISRSPRTLRLRGTDYAGLGIVMADASVRPFLQDFFDSPDYEDDPIDCTIDDDGDPQAFKGQADGDPWRSSTPLPNPGHRTTEEWVQIIRHCKKLRIMNKEYSFEVMERVAATLAKGDAHRVECISSGVCRPSFYLVAQRAVFHSLMTGQTVGCPKPVKLH
jgi:hypothetical protein